MTERSGVIYILTNPSFPDYVKIGYAKDIDRRLKELNRSECVPFAFRVYATYEVNSNLSDKKIHGNVQLRQDAIAFISGVVDQPLYGDEIIS